MSDHLLVFGSYMERCRVDSLSGATCADSRSDPALQYSGFFGPRIRAVNQTRPRSSISGLWILVWPSQIASSPQYGECPCGRLKEEGVSASRNGCFTWNASLVSGLSTGTISVLSSGDP